jgi:hypothetical protein
VGEKIRLGVEADDIGDLCMKKSILIVMFLFIAGFVFAQVDPPADDPYEKFQGIWYGVIYNGYKVVFIFIDDIFICAAGNKAAYYRYSVEDQNLIAISVRELNHRVWENEKELRQEDRIQYMFSGEKLILASDGDPTILSRNYEDFPEWW